MPMLEANPIWQALQDQHAVIAKRSISELFAADANRFDDYSISLDGLLLDYSKQPISADLKDQLLALAKSQGVAEQRAAMRAGEPINQSEGRAVLHTALRAPDHAPDWPAGIAEAVTQTRARMLALAERIRSGEQTSATGERIEHVISIGIGGSDLGPRLVLEALAPWVDGPAIHFIGNVDGVECQQALQRCEPNKTLVLVVSKSFGTPETMANAHAVMAWLRRGVTSDAVIREQVIAITAKPDQVAALGLDPERALPMWDWVGGRYSLWSAAGLAISLGIGETAFRALLGGAYAMDQHFFEAPFAHNMPVMLGLCSILNGSVLERRSQAVVPYSERLARLPAYLQQLVMESNGKSVDQTGAAVNYRTAGAIWGQTGTPGQHAFFQALHQGSDVVPVDFIGVARATAGDAGDALELSANLFAQSQALMQGRHDPNLMPAQRCPGNRPSNTLLLKALDPHHLGLLIALYEHRTFVEAAIWGINAFDQFGVELGKQLAAALKPALAGGRLDTPLDSSTAGLVEQYRRWRG